MKHLFENKKVKTERDDTLGYGCRGCDSRCISGCNDCCYISSARHPSRLRSW